MITLSNVWSKKGRPRLQEVVEQLAPWDQQVLTCKLAELDGLTERKTAVEKTLAQLYQSWPRARRLAQIDGIGIIAAVSIAARIGPVGRFARVVADETTRDPDRVVRLVYDKAFVRQRVGQIRAPRPLIGGRVVDVEAVQPNQPIGEATDEIDFPVEDDAGGFKARHRDRRAAVKGTDRRRVGCDLLCWSGRQR